MDKPLKVLLVEDDPAECAAISRCIESVEEIHLVSITNSASKAIEHVKDYIPDAVILDLELHKGYGDGVTFLSDLNKLCLQSPPYVLVTTNNISRITHEQARCLGADFVMVKSQKDYSAENVVVFLKKAKDIIHTSQSKQRILPEPETPNETKNRIHTRAVTEIEKIGISPKLIGRSYLLDAIILAVENKHTFVQEIAKKYEKTDASVVRAMQNAINRAWRTANIADLQQNYKARIASEKGVPTLNEFIFYYANILSTEYNISSVQSSIQQE